MEQQGNPVHQNTWGGKRYGVSVSQYKSIVFCVIGFLHDEPTMTLARLSRLVEMVTNINRSTRWYSTLLKNIQYSYRIPDYKSRRKFTLSNLEM